MKNTISGKRMIMFTLIFVSIVTLLHSYAIWRLSSAKLFKWTIHFKPILWIGIGLWFMTIVGAFLGHHSTNKILSILYKLGMNWMVILFLLFSLLVIAEVPTGFGFLLKKHIPIIRGSVLAVSLLLAIIAFVQGMRPPVLNEYKVRLKNLPEEMNGKVIVAISDLHLGETLGPNWLDARVKQTQELNPDMIVLLGDTFEGHGQPHEQFIPGLKKLSAPLGVWAVLGNHAFYGRENGSISLIEESGIPLLRNKWVEPVPGIIIAGVDDLSVNGRSGNGRDLIKEALKGSPEGAKILLSHSPLQIDKAVDNGVGLMLSGHTHSGQVWPFGYIVRIFYPYIAGEYKIDGMTLIVSRGTGTWGPRTRLWKRGEISRIELQGSKNNNSESYYSIYVCGNVINNRTEAEIIFKQNKDSKEVDVGIVYEDDTGWKTEHFEQNIPIPEREIEKAKVVLSKYVNRKGIEITPGLSKAAHALMLMLKTDGTALGQKLED